MVKGSEISIGQIEREKLMLYGLLKMIVSVCFNILNKVLGGRLPPFGSAAVIVERDGHFLVIELPGGRLAFPGGFMRWEEIPEQAALREGKEETGLDLRIDRLFNVYSHTKMGIFKMSTICFVYQAEVVGGQLRDNKEGKPRWATEAELRAHFGEHTLGILGDYLRSRQANHDNAASQGEAQGDESRPADIYNVPISTSFPLISRVAD
jgi:ADP-ribose pyrophosphatase YjhB (NUDIX family)